MKKIVWNLFGGLNNSVLNALGNDDYDIYTFDILEEDKQGRKNIQVDLTANNSITLLAEYPKPDIIVASPMCNSFSRARAYKDGGRGGWVINKDNSLSLRTYESWLLNRSEKRKDKWEGVLDTAILGKKAIEKTIKIIQFFKPKYWYIENPESSLIWKYIENNLNFYGIKNLTKYGNYNFFAEKKTIFLSNKNLNLKYEPFKNKNKGIDNIAKKHRSDIPPLLIHDIFNQFEKKKDVQLIGAWI